MNTVGHIWIPVSTATAGRRVLYQTYGKAQMARELDALTHEEFMEINHMTVYFMNTDHEYILHKNKEFNVCDVAI